jgi:hypothetical protein
MKGKRFSNKFLLIVLSVVIAGLCLSTTGQESG